MASVSWICVFFTFGVFDFYKAKEKKEINSLIWLLIAFLSLLIAGEEISWGERLTGIGLLQYLIWMSKEKQIFIIYLFSSLLIGSSFEITCIFLGWFSWRKFKKLMHFRVRIFLVFSICRSFLFLFWYFLGFYNGTDKEWPRNFEFLLSSGLFLHCLKNFKNSGLKIK